MMFALRVEGGARLSLFVGALLLAGCGSSSSDKGTNANAQGGDGANTSGSTSSGGNGSGADGNNGGRTSNGGTSSGAGSGNHPMLPTVPGEVDPNAPDGTALKPLPRMINVVANATGDSVGISFSPIDGAVDYRVYVLPDNGDVTNGDDGELSIKNAIYRCAGNRQAPAATMDGAAQVQSGAIKTLVDGQSVEGYKRTLADAQLGFVYLEPGDGRVPVYALGDNDGKADTTCYFMRWGASRVKKYTTSKDERDKLVAQGFRDDGIVFYAPADGADGTVQISMQERTGTFPRLYFVGGSPEAAMRKTSTPAFSALAAAADDTVPLMRVFYQNACGISHDELVATMSMFNRVRTQGDQQPVFNLHWSGLTGPTTLVVEALDQGCPYSGALAAKSADAYVDKEQTITVNHEAWLTLADAQAASATGEVFINGQYDTKVAPRPIARSFVKISPAAAPDLDWSYGFKADDSLGTFTDAPCGDENCFQQFRQQSASADVVFMYVETQRWAQASTLGELWINYADLGADVNGKFRLTPPEKADMTADSFLYATMEVDDFTTQRRYPQIMISDQEAPVQAHLKTGNTMIIQTFGDWPSTYELQVCDHRYWDVNNQCPRFDFYHQLDPNDPMTVTGLAPVPEVGELVGMDRSTRFEVYASTKRVYLMLGGQPYGCADLPTSGIPKGPATVTFADVLYHSDADNTFDFTHRKLQWETRRHMDNLGFKSHVAAPAWDEKRFPCTSRLKD